MSEQDKSGVLLECVAIQATTLKASKALASDLSESDKLAVLSGSRIKAKLAGRDGEYWLVDNVTVNGIPAGANLRFMYAAHWKELGEVKAKTVSVDGARRQPVIDNYAEQRAKSRRLYAGFRRRLAQV